MERMQEINQKILARIPVSSAEMAAWRQWQWAGAPSQPSSSSGGKKRKKRKRRKKKVPKTHSSSHFLQGSKAVTGYSGRDGSAPGMEEGNKLIEKKVIAGDIWEDIFHKNGLPAMNLYSDPTHLYISPSGKCWLGWRKIVNDTYGDWGTHRHGQICCLLLYTAKPVVMSELSKRSPQTSW